MSQRFYASNDAMTWPNGAVGYRPGGSFDCLGPFSKVRNCPIFAGERDTGLRLTCYASGYADTFFSVPANTRYRGHHIRGYFTSDSHGVHFQVMDSHKEFFNNQSSDWSSAAAEAKLEGLKFESCVYSG